MHFDIRSHLVGAHPKLELTTWAQSDDILHSYVNRLLKTRVANLMRSRGITDEGEYRSAAQAVFSVVLHLLELDAGDGSEYVPGRLVQPAGPAGVAGVMEGYCHRHLMGELHSALRNLFGHHLAVVFSLEGIVYPQLLRPLRIVGLPHQVTSRA